MYACSLKRLGHSPTLHRVHPIKRRLWLNTVPSLVLWIFCYHRHPMYENRQSGHSVILLGTVRNVVTLCCAVVHWRPCCPCLRKIRNYPWFVMRRGPCPISVVVKILSLSGPRYVLSMSNNWIAIWLRFRLPRPCQPSENYYMLQMMKYWRTPVGPCLTCQMDPMRKFRPSLNQASVCVSLNCCSTARTLFKPLH